MPSSAAKTVRLSYVLKVKQLVKTYSKEGNVATFHAAFDTEMGSR
jgi:hypothetical protein